MNQKRLRSPNKHGFTLIEIMITMAISGVVAGLIFSAYVAQQKAYINQEQIADMQQNFRAAMHHLERDIRMAGHDTTPSRTTGAGIQEAHTDSITFTMDMGGGGTDGADNDKDGLIDEADEANLNDGALDDVGEDITFFLSDIDGDGDNDLARRDNIVGVPTDLEEEFVAENIEAIGFAYAFDQNRDGNLDTYSDTNGDPRIIWAVDTNSDGYASTNFLDRNLDTNNDGNIDALDGPGIGGNGLITGQTLVDVDGAPIPNVAPGRIRAVRVWMLARSARQDLAFENPSTYVVGRQVMTPMADSNGENDNRRMRLVETIIKCRNQ